MYKMEVRILAAITKLHKKCKKCKHKENCNDKRMVACAIAELPPTLVESAGMGMAEHASMPMVEKHTPITINLGEYGTINTSLEKMSKRLEEDIYKRIRCGFNGTL